MKIILASSSPQRIEMMRWLDVPFTSISHIVNERTNRYKDAVLLTRQLAEDKAFSLSPRFKKAIIIGSDAVVQFRGRVIEKPKDIEHQRRLLLTQRGKAARVVSSICVLNTYTGYKIVRTQATDFVMSRISDHQIEKYLKTCKGLDKAGGYGLQDGDGVFLEKLMGCYTNSIGFPLCVLIDALRRMEVVVNVDIKKVVKEKTGMVC